MYSKDTTAFAATQQNDVEFPFYVSHKSTKTTDSKDFEQILSCLQRQQKYNPDSKQDKGQLPVLAVHTKTANRAGGNISLKLTGFVCIDLDHRDKQDLSAVDFDFEQLQKIRTETLQAFQRLKDISFVRLAFVSPTGQGIKVFVQIPGIEVESKETGTEYIKAAYDNAAAAILSHLQGFNLEADAGARDLKRLCYVPANRQYGHDLFYNADSPVFNAFKFNTEPKTQNKPKTESKTQNKPKTESKTTGADENRERWTLKKEYRLKNLNSIISFLSDKKDMEYKTGQRNPFAFNFALKANYNGIPIRDAVSFFTSQYGQLQHFQQDDIQTIERVYKTYSNSFGCYLEMNEGKAKALSSVIPNYAKPAKILKFKGKLQSIEKELFSALSVDKVNLIQAKTGSGKTYTLSHNAINRNELTVFAVPNVDTARQLFNEYYSINKKVIGAYEGITTERIKEHIKMYDGDCLIFTTYASITKIERAIYATGKRIDHFIIDEFHASINMQAIAKENIRALYRLFYSDKVKLRTFVTATPSMILQQQEVLTAWNINWIQCEKLDIKKTEIRWIADNKNETFLHYISSILQTNPDDKVMIRCSSRKRLEDIQIMLNDILGEKSVIIHAKVELDGDGDEENKARANRNHIIENQTIAPETRIILCTNMFDSAINIKNADVIPVFLMNSNESYNYENVEQFFNRFRESEHPRYLFARAKSTESKPQWLSYRWEYSIATGIARDFETVDNWEERREEMMKFRFLSVPILKVKKIDGRGDIDEQQVLIDANDRFYRSLNPKILIQQMQQQVAGCSFVELPNPFGSPKERKDLSKRIFALLSLYQDEGIDEKDVIKLLSDESTCKQVCEYYINKGDDLVSENRFAIEFLNDDEQIEISDEVLRVIIKDDEMVLRCLNKFIRIFPFAFSLGLNHPDIAYLAVKNENNAKFKALNARIAMLHRRANKDVYRLYLPLLYGNQQLAESAFIEIMKFQWTGKKTQKDIIKEFRQQTNSVPDAADKKRKKKPKRAQLKDISDRNIWLLLTAVNKVKCSQKTVGADDNGKPKKERVFERESQFTMDDLRETYFESKNTGTRPAPNQRTSFDFDPVAFHENRSDSSDISVKSERRKSEPRQKHPIFPIKLQNGKETKWGNKYI